MEMMEEELKQEEKPVPVEAEDRMMPTLVEFPIAAAPVMDLSDMKEEEEPAIIHFELMPEEKLLSNYTNENTGKTTVENLSTIKKKQRYTKNQKSLAMM